MKLPFRERAKGKILPALEPGFTARRKKTHARTSAPGFFCGNAGGQKVFSIFNRALPTASEMLIIFLTMDRVVNAPGKSILLVDDDPHVRRSIKLLLNIDRHTVTEAANGHEALQLFTGSQYDLVITDYRMPGMLGDELVRNIKNIAPAQPILMVTAHFEMLVDADKPAKAVLGKPFSIDALRRAVALQTG
jgi:CheY-like chemotaxis protein